MPIDYKYGKITLEHGTLGEDEPVVVFRAKDAFLLQMLDYYRTLCRAGGSSVRHLIMIDRSQEAIMLWQMENEPRIPNSDASKDWMD